MRSSLHGPEAYLLKSKKPHIQELVERAKTMTEEEIRALPEKPDVIKGLLNIHKQADQNRAASVAEKLADMMQAAYNNS
jgi:hypothetical protein